jgi:hypothetical protein
MLNQGVLRKTAVALGLSLVATFAVDTALAQAPAAKPDAGKVGGGDKTIAAKKGVGESLGNKEFDQEKLPGTLEIGLALGSIAGVVAAIKWL